MEGFGARRARGRKRAAELICTEGAWSLAPLAPPLLVEAPLLVEVPLAALAAPLLIQWPLLDEPPRALLEEAPPRSRKRARPAPPPFLRTLEAFLDAGPAGSGALRAVAPWSPRAQSLRVLPEPVPMPSAPHVVLVHDGGPGFLARRVRSLGLPYSIDVVVPDTLDFAYLLHWQAVYPKTQLGYLSSRPREPRRRRGGVRLWSRSRFLQCRDRNDVLVAEEMQDWPTASRPDDWALSDGRARAVVVGCAGIGARVRALLPHLRRWDFDERLHVRRRGAAQLIESKLGAPNFLLQSSQYVRWIVELADCLPLLLQREEGPDLAAFWSAFASARAYVELKLREDSEDSTAEAGGRALKCLASWTCRVALLDSCATLSNDKVRSEAAGPAAFLGADLALVCPECLALGPHSPCDWDLRTQPRQGAVALHEMKAFSLSRYVSRITPAWALNARQFLLSAQATGATVPRETRRPEAGLLLLRAWFRCLALEVRRDAFDGPFDLSFMGSRGVSLHLTSYQGIFDYCRSVGQAQSFLGELWALGAPVVEGRALTWGPFPTDASPDSRALRTYVAHLARAGGLAGRVARVATRLLVDFLAVNWRVLADPRALLRHGFHKEIAEVHVYPSFLCSYFFLETDATEHLRLLRSRFPRANIVWHARAQSPSALALGAIFGKNVSKNGRVRYALRVRRRHRTAELRAICTESCKSSDSAAPKSSGTARTRRSRLPSEVASDRRRDKKMAQCGPSEWRSSARTARARDAASARRSCGPYVPRAA